MSYSNFLFTSWFPWKFLIRWQKAINTALSCSGMWCWVAQSPSRRNVSGVQCPWGARCESLGRGSLASEKTEASINLSCLWNSKNRSVSNFFEFNLRIVTAAVTLDSEFTAPSWPSYMSAELRRRLADKIYCLYSAFFEVFPNAVCNSEILYFYFLNFLPWGFYSSFLFIIS